MSKSTRKKKKQKVSRIENDDESVSSAEYSELQNDDGVCFLQETVFVDSLIPDEEIFKNLKVKVEPVFVETDVEQLIDLDSENYDSQIVTKKRKKKKKVFEAKKKKIPKDRVTAMREKIKLNKSLNEDNENNGKRCRINNPKLDVYKTELDETGKEVKIKVKETANERRRRLARERMRRRRNNMTEFERQLAMRKQRIQKQKLRLRQRLEETEEEAERRRREYRDQKRKSRQKMREFTESVTDEDSKRCLSSFTTPDGDVVYETPDEKERRLARERQRRRRLRIAELEKEIELERMEMNLPSLKETERDDETEDDSELKILKYKLEKERNRHNIKELTELEEEDSNIPAINLNGKRRDAQLDFFKLKKKRAPGDIEYLYFYENSEERRKRLDRERHKAKYLARKQMELEMLDIENESDMTTSRRCLDID